MTRLIGLLLFLTTLTLGNGIAAQEANEVDMAVDPITPVESGAEIEPPPDGVAALERAAEQLGAESQPREAEIEAAFEELVAESSGQAGWPNSATEFLATQEDLSIFLMLLEEAELTESLAQDEGPITIFAPSDAAFARMDQHDFERMFDDSAGLRDFLERHIAAGTYTTSDLTAQIAGGGAANDADVQATLDLGEAQIVQRDLAIDGLTLHIIDRVLLPAEPGDASVR